MLVNLSAAQRKANPEIAAIADRLAALLPLSAYHGSSPYYGNGALTALTEVYGIPY